MIPGELLPAEGSVELNAGRETSTVTVANLGDRPVQVGSHFHFFSAPARVLTASAQTLYGALNGCRELVRTHLELPAPAREVL